MNHLIRQATTDDVALVSSILTEAAVWLKELGKPLWRTENITPEQIAKEVNLFFIAYVGGQVAGTLKFQTEDKLFWPDVPDNNSAYVHRLAIRRRFAGQGVSTIMLLWAVNRARSLGKQFLRLDCEATRLRLRKIYEDFGFIYNSDKLVGSCLVARYEYKINPI